MCFVPDVIMFVYIVSRLEREILSSRHDIRLNNALRKSENVYCRQIKLHGYLIRVKFESQKNIFAFYTVTIREPVGAAMLQDITKNNL